MTNEWKVTKRYNDGQPSEYRRYGKGITVVLKHIYGSYGWASYYMRKGTRHVVSGPWPYTDLDTAKQSTRRTVQDTP